MDTHIHARFLTAITFTRSTECFRQNRRQRTYGSSGFSYTMCVLHHLRSLISKFLQLEQLHTLLFRTFCTRLKYERNITAGSWPQRVSRQWLDPSFFPTNRFRTNFLSRSHQIVNTHHSHYHLFYDDSTGRGRQHRLERIYWILVPHSIYVYHLNIINLWIQIYWK